MNQRQWVTSKIKEIEEAYARAMAILGDPEKGHAHEIVVSAVADMVIAKAYLESSLTLKGGGDEVKTE